MLIFDNLELVFLAAPKSGSTSFEKAFRAHANRRLNKGLPKHLRYNRFCKLFPEIAERYEAVTVLRDPLETLYSWYRYRTHWRLLGHPRSTRAMSFSEFFEEWCKDDPKEFASMNPSVNFVLDRKGNQFPGLKVIRYEDNALLLEHIRKRLGIEKKLKRHNVAPGSGGGVVGGITRVLRGAEAGDVTKKLGQAELRSQIDGNHPKIVEAYETYRRIAFTEVADLRSGLVIAGD